MSATQIVERQIADQAITNAKIKAGAAIATSKLADGANFIKRDGSVAMTGALDMGGQLINNLGTPSASGDAATKSYVDTQISNLNALFDSKGSCKAASTANVTISNPATSTIDGVALSNGDRVLLKNQTAPAENGIYTFATSSTAMVRATDMDAWTEVPGAFLAVEEGTANADTVWLCTANQGGTINTTAITFQQIPTTAGLLSANFVTRETPSGSVNGSNTTFTLANTPTAATEEVYLNGLLQDVGAGNDYTVSGATLTFLDAPLTGDKIRVNYRK